MVWSERCIFGSEREKRSEWSIKMGREFMYSPYQSEIASTVLWQHRRGRRYS